MAKQSLENLYLQLAYEKEKSIIRMQGKIKISRETQKMGNKKWESITPKALRVKNSIANFLNQKT